MGSFYLQKKDLSNDFKLNYLPLIKSQILCDTN